MGFSGSSVTKRLKEGHFTTVGSQDGHLTCRGNESCKVNFWSKEVSELSITYRVGDITVRISRQT